MLFRLLQIGPWYLEDNHTKDEYIYKVSIKTGYYSGSSTSSDVFIILIGSDGTSTPRKLCSSKCQCFNKGETDVFILAFPYGFGKIKEIQVWHNNTGNSPGWFFLQAKVSQLGFSLLLCNKLMIRNLKDTIGHFSQDTSWKNNITGQVIKKGYY